MFVRYLVGEGEKNLWEDESPEIFKKIEKATYYQRCIYLYPSLNERPPVWLWVVGHEKADPTKAEYNRVWRTRLVLHFCVKGKGYYNGELITPGMAFLSWPMMPHSMVADPEDPFEYYWMMVRGEDTVPFAKQMGFSATKLIFPCDYINEVVPLLEHYINMDHSKISLLDYTDSLMRMVFSCQKKTREAFPNISKRNSANYAHYVDLSKHFLYDNNFAVSVQEVAEMLGVSPKHFNRVFHDVVGIPPKQYITEQRLELGVTLLKNGMSPVEVSNVLRYTDYAMFYRAFKKRYGVSPSKYNSKS